MVNPIAEGAGARDSRSSGDSRAYAMYDLGSSTVYASRTDPRFSFCTYVPPDFSRAPRKMELVVVIHGTARTFGKYRDAFCDFAKWNDCIVLCPLFPAGVLGDGSRDGFKYLVEGDIRYDQILLGMVREIEEKYDCHFPRFALFGYSGGGQFVNRFCFLYPEKLWAASIGAPGSVTLLDASRHWWVGVQGMEERFGKALNLEALRKVPVHMVVGKADLETWEITHHEGGKFYMPGANDAGKTRPERLESLSKSFEAAGVKVRLDILPNVPHNGLACVGKVQDFFAEILQNLRARNDDVAPAAG